MVILLWGYLQLLNNNVALQLLHRTILKNNYEICIRYLSFSKTCKFDPFKQGF